MEYTKFTPEDQLQMLEQRLVQIELEHYGHKLNKDYLESLDSKDEETLEEIKLADDAMIKLDLVHADLLKRIQTFK